MTAAEMKQIADAVREVEKAGHGKVEIVINGGKITLINQTNSVKVN